MEIRVTVVLVSVAVALLLSGGVMAVERRGSGGRSCDLSFFRTIPPAVMTTFWKAQRLYDSTHSRSDSGSSSRSESGSRTTFQLATTDELRALSVPERMILVHAEFDHFSAVLSSREGTFRAAGRKVWDLLVTISEQLEHCVQDSEEEALGAGQFSGDLARLLQRLKNDFKSGDAAALAEMVFTNLVQLLNEHLTCVAKGTSC
ncbi:interferon lambda-3-like [Narcine bancroftii]|uniref:interferon lambda-3-like n=1 Tax=Narcine bancroftii TaxID=1343680 RepID=UPI003831E46C